MPYRYVKYLPSNYYTYIVQLFSAVLSSYSVTPLDLVCDVQILKCEYIRVVLRHHRGYGLPQLHGVE